MCDVLVSVAVITFGHEKYIRQALDSILMQKVSFKYEIVIGEDCSPDNSREIILEYKRNYSDIIKLRLHDENVGITKNWYDVFMNCKGKYITILEGDDYWSDPLKLEKQVQFLNNHLDYIAVGCTTNNIDIEGNSIEMNYGNSFPGRDFSMNLFLKGYTFVCVTVMFRNIFLDKGKDYDIIWKFSHHIADTTLNIILLNQSSIRILEDCMFVHRIRNVKGELNYNSIVDTQKKLIHQIEVLVANDQYYKNKYNLNYKYTTKFADLLLYCIRRGKMEDFVYQFRKIENRKTLTVSLVFEISKRLLNKLLRLLNK